MYCFVQYFENHCLSLSGCYNLWLSETSSLQFKKKRVYNMIWYKCSETNGFAFYRIKFENDTIKIKIMRWKNTK